MIKGFKKNLSKRVWQVSTFAFMMLAVPIQAGATSRILNPNATAPTWLNKLAGVLTEPLGWIKWIAILAGVLLISVNGLKYKAANGDTQKMEKALQGMKSTAIGAVIVFSASGIGQWFFDKLV